MSLHPIRKYFAFFAFAFATVAHAASPHYADMKLSDSDGGESSDSFTPDTAKIYLNAGLVDVPSGTKLSSTWIAEDTNGAAPANFKIDSVELTTGALTNVATFSLSRPNAGWPVGKYRVDLFIDGHAAGTMHFTVEKD